MNFLGMGASKELGVTNANAIGNPIIRRLASGIEAVIKGKSAIIQDFLIGVVAGGSLLLEDYPGLGKTTLAKTFAQLIELKFDRLQCTPDLLPADVLGFSIYNAQQGDFTFRHGPIFCNVLLVDEINRASPRTQSALLEAMAERQVTLDGVGRPLPTPFLVVATQNPQGFQGTYPLPEAQLDRFLFCLTLDYPDHESEVDLLYERDPFARQAPSAVATVDELRELQRAAREVSVHRDIGDYIIRIVRETRTSNDIQLGASPRGAQMLFRAAQATALVAGRTHVVPDDVQHVAPKVLAHRLVTKRSTHSSHFSKRALVDQLVKKVTVPV